MKRKVIMFIAFLIIFIILSITWNITTTNSSKLSKEYKNNVVNVVKICEDYINGNTTKLEAQVKIESIYNMMSNDTSRKDTDNQAFLKVSAINAELKSKNADISRLKIYVHELNKIK